jgi:DNA-binding NtrC family response regulator
LSEVARHRVLLVEDDSAHAALIEDVVRSVGAEVDRVTSGAAACDRLVQREYQAMILDVGLPDMSGFEVQRWTSGRAQVPPIVFVTADEDVEHAVGAMQSGARHYVVKRRNYLRQVEVAVRTLLHSEVAPPGTSMALASAIIGDSPEIKTIRRRIREFGPSSAPVLIAGETGTGKELVARAIHNASPYRDGPFVTVNCSALSQRVIDEWALYSGDGAVRGNRDPVAMARLGTLFLDGVGELPLELQGGLLRLVGSDEARALGAGKSESPRVISSTQVDLDRKAILGQFRPDLYHRLNGLRIEVPPLRDRRSDIPLLAKYFIARYAPSGVELRLARDAVQQLLAETWAGNVRELEQVVRRTLAGWVGGPIYRCDMGKPLGAAIQQQDDNVTRQELVALLMQCKGRLRPVADVLGVSVRTVQRRMVGFEIKLRDLRDLSRSSMRVTE